MLCCTMSRIQIEPGWAHSIFFSVWNFPIPIEFQFAVQQGLF